MSNPNSNDILLKNKKSLGGRFQEILKEQAEIQKYYKWNFKKDYFSLIQNSSIERVQQHFRNTEPLFMMGFRKDLMIAREKNLYEIQGILEKSNITKEDKQRLIYELRDYMKLEMEELKETLLSFGLGFIPLLGRWTPKREKSVDLGIEMSVLVPMSPKYTGYKWYTGDLSNEWKDVDFQELAIALKDEYEQESIVWKGTRKTAQVFYSRNNFEELGNTVSLSAKDIEEYASRLVKGNQSNSEWWTLTDEESNQMGIISLFHSYNADEMTMICGEFV